MRPHQHKRLFALKSLKVFALFLFLSGTVVGCAWFLAFLRGLNPNLINSPQDNPAYSFSQGTKDFSRAALCYGCGLISLYSAVKFEREINHLKSQSRLP